MSDRGGTPGFLALADGSVFEGVGFGAINGVSRAVAGEVVFNSSMYGYQEICSDPSYCGQIMCFAFPQIGNVGCNPDDNERERVHVAGVLIRNLTRISSNFRALQSFDDYLVEAGVMGLARIDTRALVTHLRDRGSQMGAMACGQGLNPDDLVDLARSQGSMEGRDCVHDVSCKQPYLWNEMPWSFEDGGFKAVPQEKLWSRPHVVVLDCGVKRNILRGLFAAGFRVTVVPADYSASQIMELRPDAFFLSNGPGDPAALPGIVSNVRDVLGRLPIFGIGLGHQILGLALGGKTYKLKFGHRGNHPVMDLSTKKVEITAQNHGFAVSQDSLPKDLSVSHLNLNDHTVEGLVAHELAAFSVQYNPEASPGPHDALYIFSRFFESVIGAG